MDNSKNALSSTKVQCATTHTGGVCGGGRMYDDDNDKACASSNCLDF